MIQIVHLLQLTEYISDMGQLSLYFVVFSGSGLHDQHIVDLDGPETITLYMLMNSPIRIDTI